ncbi:hypothetical protein JY494_11935 [Serratia marcescens]|jgi:hypothetical protein|nr:hypothetical protein [Serratia marcescens]
MSTDTDESYKHIPLKEGEVCPKTGVWTVGENNSFVTKEVFENELCKTINEGELAPRVPYGLPYWVFYEEC